MQWNNMTIEIDNSNFYDDPVDNIYYDFDDEDYNRKQLYYDEINTDTAYSHAK